MMKRVESVSDSFFVDDMDIEDYEIIERFGRTYAGLIYRVQKKSENNRDYLLFNIDNDYPELTFEVERLMNLRDRTGMLIIYGIIRSNNSDLKGTSILTEFPEKGNLNDLLQTVSFTDPESPINPFQLACLLFSLSNACRILHTEDIFYNYFDPSFIYLGTNYELKLANPGITAFFNPEKYRSEEENDQFFLAPEIFQGQHASIYSDVYSFGSLLYQLYSHEIRFPKANQDKPFMSNILNGVIPLFPTSMPMMVRNTITQCWKPIPTDRPLFKHILQNMLRSPEFFFNLRNPKEFYEYQRSLISPDVIHTQIFSASSSPLSKSSNRSSILSLKYSKKSLSQSQLPRSKSEPSIKTINPNKIDILSNKGKHYANKIIALQLLIMSLSFRNFESSKANIIKKFEKEKAYTVVSMCILGASCRYNRIILYAKVMEILYSVRSKHKNMSKIPDIFIKLVWESLIQGETFPRDISKLCLMSYCRIVGLLSDQQVVSFVRDYYEKYEKAHKKTLVMLFAWFAPEIEKIDNELFERLREIMVEIQTYPNLPTAFQHFYNLFDNLRAENWTLLRNVVEDNNKSGKSINYILRHDDLKALKYFNHTKHISMNKRISSEIYCPCSFVHDKPTMIMYAAAYGSENCFQFMQAKKAPLGGKDDKYRTISTFAVLGGNITIVQFIQSMNDSFDTGLQSATLMHHYSLFNHLLKQKKFDLEEPDKFDKKVITTAASANNLCVFLHCLKNGVKLDTHETFGWTPLHTAAEKGNVEMIKLILHCQGWDPNIKDTWGTTPLHLATDRLHTEAVRVFLKKKTIDVNVVNEKKKTPFLIAAKAKYLPIVMVFLDCQRVDFQACSNKIFFLYFFIKKTLFI